MRKSSSRHVRSFITRRFVGRAFFARAFVSRAGALRVAALGLLPLPLACSEMPETDGISQDGSLQSGGSTQSPGGGGEGASVFAGGTGGVVGAGASSGTGAGDGLIIDKLSGGSGGGSAEPVIRDGGTVVLTEEEVTQIEQSECTGSSAIAELVPAVLQLVVDVSLSMGDPAPGAPMGVDKWDITSEALLAAVAALPDEMAVGMTFFPTAAPPRGGGEQIPIEPCVDDSGMTPIDFLGPEDSAQRSSIETSIRTVPLILGTPTHDGYRFALDESLTPTTIMGQKSMLLITDGAPTQELGCGDLLQAGSPTQPIIDDIAAAYAQGIRTYIIGAPGSEENGQTGEDLRGWLSEAAMAGGTAADGCAAAGPNFCHFDMTEAPDFATALAEGLAEISQNVADVCTFEMPEPPEGMTSTDIDLTSVIIKWGDGTAELVQRDDVADCAEGWIVNAEGKIALCEATCARVELDHDVETTVSMGCDPAVIVVR